MSDSADFSQQFLKDAAYADDANLSARQAIYRYQDEPFDFPAWALGHVQWTGHETVVDVGCGNGLYLQRLAHDRKARRLVGLDLSTGMLGSTLRRWPEGVSPPSLVTADAQQLPLADACADVALAMHMLYHVPDIPTAVRELRRVVCPGGTLVAAGNASGTLRELYRLRVDAMSKLAGRAVEGFRWFKRFNLDSGDLLSACFDHVEVHRSDRELHVPVPEPVVAFLDSTSQPPGVLPADVDWSDVVAEMHRAAAERIEAEGSFTVTASMGVFVCR